MPFGRRVRRGGKRPVKEQYPSTVATAVVTRVTITNEEPPNFEPGNTFQVNVTVAGDAVIQANEDGSTSWGYNTLTGRTVTYASSDTNICSVSGSGLVTAVAVGACSITAACEGVTSTAIAVTVTLPLSAVASVTISPTSVSMFEGQQTTLTATPKDASGNALQGKTVTWDVVTAARGTLSSSQTTDPHSTTLTAGTAGSTTITATCDGIQGVISYTVSAAATDYPNEPAGMTRIFEWDFSAKPPANTGFAAGAYGLLAGDAWMQGGAGWDVISDATAPQSPNGVLRVKYAAGLAPGNGPDGAWYGWVAGTNLDYAEIYESGRFKLAGNNGTWQHPTAGFKGLGYWACNNRAEADNQIYASILGATSSGGLAGSYATFVIDMRGQNAAVSFTKSYNENTTTYITEGQWHRYELRMVCNTPGTDNGILQLWIDGTRVMNYSNIRFRTVTYAEGFFSKTYVPIWGGSGSTVVAADQYIHWDHVYVSAKGAGE